jgi:hypothetical protein
MFKLEEDCIFRSPGFGDCDLGCGVCVGEGSGSIKVSSKSCGFISDIFPFSGHGWLQVTLGNCGMW